MNEPTFPDQTGCAEPDHACPRCGDCQHEHPGAGGCRAVAPAVTVHACPPAGSRLMPCCGRTPFEAPGEDRITSDPALVTCTSELERLRTDVTGRAPSPGHRRPGHGPGQFNPAGPRRLLQLPARDGGLTMPDAEQFKPVDWQAVATQRERELKGEGERRQLAEGARDGAYRERAHLVALLAAMTTGAVIAPALDVDEPGWQIAYLTIGGRQASWHISPADADLFSLVPRVASDDPRAQWDGHSTDEKYAHLREHTAELWRRCGPECSESHSYTGRCEGAHRQKGEDR